MKSGPRRRHTAISAPATTPPWPRASSSASAKKSTSEWTPGCTARRPIRARRRGRGCVVSQCPGRIGFGAVVLGLGSMGMAIGATAAVLHPGDSPGQVSGGAAVLIALIWIVIGVINVAYARYRLLSASLSAAYLWRSPAGCSGALMSSDHEAEIRASVAAHADLGPGYDDAVAEGLVERIGAEIDKRIDARLGQFGAAGAPGPPGLRLGLLAWLGLPAWLALAAWLVRPVCPFLRVALVRLVRGALACRDQRPRGIRDTRRRSGTRDIRGTRGTWVPCCRPGTRWGRRRSGRLRPGSATWRRRSPRSGPWPSASRPRRSCRTTTDSGGQAFMVLLIWIAIAVINVAYARRLTVP